ncbi:hypothetical protein BDR05DRAFT_948689 [Suillus weaverae]|nr:hypothetical protein BDR05DRAFT_948689 [Suillus weaverae]
MLHIAPTGTPFFLPTNMAPLTHASTPINVSLTQPSVVPNTLQGGTTPYIYYPPPTSSAVSITACCLSKNDLNKIKLLDRVKNNWTSWSKLMLEIFHMNLLEGYTTETVVHPDATHELIVARNWDLNNTRIVAVLCNRVSPDDKCILDGITNARVAWNALCTHHQKLSPMIAQILKIQELLNVRYSKDTDMAVLAKTSHCLTEGICAIFNMGILTQQVFLSIIICIHPYLLSLYLLLPAFLRTIATCNRASHIPSLQSNSTLS